MNQISFYYSAPGVQFTSFFFLIFQLRNTFVAKLFFHQNENVDIKKELFIATGLYGDFALQTT